ncbi:MAG: TrmO family methyltransferase domain-containing protein [Candidatus Hecatellaceae archaeon]
MVKLIERKGNILKVKGLDAIDGTPLIDIKPFSPKLDFIPDAKIEWLEKAGKVKEK